MTTNYVRSERNTERTNRVQNTENTYNDRFLITANNIEMIKEANLMCLRNKKTGRVENVSYTEHGLTWTFDKLGLPLYYKYPNTVFSSSGYATATFKGTFEKNPNMIVEPFIPVNHVDSEGRMNVGAQKSEITFVAKALRLMAPMNMGGEKSETISEVRNRIALELDKAAVV